MLFRIWFYVLLTLALAGCGALGGQTPTPLPTVVLVGGNATPQATGAAPSGGIVTASGHIEPAEQAQLSFATAGKVETVTVAVGDAVQAGQVLITLEGSDQLAAAVETAKLDVLNAQQALNDLQDSAAMVTAQAQQAVATAQSALTKAQRDLRNTQNPAGQSLYDAVHDTQLVLQTAQANAQLSTVSQSVQDYTSNYWLTDYYWKRYQDLRAKYQAAPNPDSETKMNNAYSDWKVLADQQAQRQLTFQTDQANKNDAVSKAQKAYDDAVNNLNNAQKGPDADKLSVAQANLSVAQATLAQAQTHYAAVKTGPDPEILAADQQRLATAQAQLAAAKSALGDLELKASITGAVTDLTIHTGEWVTPGLAVITLADVAHLQVETTDLSERDVPQVAIGQPVSVQVKALNQAVPGKVLEIAPLADTLGGDVVYKTTISLSSAPSGLRAGMSVDVQFGVTP